MAFITGTLYAAFENPGALVRWIFLSALAMLSVGMLVYYLGSVKSKQVIAENRKMFCPDRVPDGDVHVINLPRDEARMGIGMGQTMSWLAKLTSSTLHRAPFFSAAIFLVLATAIASLIEFDLIGNAALWFFVVVSVAGVLATYVLIWADLWMLVYGLDGPYAAIKFHVSVEQCPFGSSTIHQLGIGYRSSLMDSKGMMHTRIYEEVSVVRCVVDIILGRPLLAFRSSPI
ncbi:hypothetical protein PV963_25055 [Streptomyces coeruleorubidus]|uniref:hypothetical protein n=1 Tax=Streptomyces coeruleorubidus TaxID=116188 RepID=UPI00237F25F8|nr:hypothetical protein [Streptomyces coeruleorubidus]WDV53396.1 hypothetical protein PV963_25055 [Streptomyces coeruleorubidus]